MTTSLFWLAVIANVITVGTGCVFLCRWLRKQYQRLRRRWSRLCHWPITLRSEGSRLPA